MNRTPVLEGYGVRLEPMSLAHIPALTPVILEPSNWRYMAPRVESVADVQTHVEAALRDAETGTVEPWVTIANGHITGGTRLYDIDRTHRRAEIGSTWIARPWRGAGLNPRVKLLQMTYGFETLGLRRIALRTHHENLQSQHAMLKLGATYEGTLRNHMLMPDGSTRHTMYYSVTQEEWLNVKENLLNRIQHEALTVPHGE
jgi:RimJ/RimL family protein N-acetyltransferase